jgi:hypothetical protein
MAISLRCELLSLSPYPSRRGANAAFQSGGRVEYPWGRATKGGEMYIGGGALALIVIVLLLIWLL